MGSGIASRCARPKCGKPFALSVVVANRKRQRFCSARCQQLEWMRIYQVQWRKTHPERYKENTRRWQQKNRRVIHAAKRKPCADCKTRYPYYVMDFDHVRGVKRFDISRGANSQTVSAVIAEIAKCDVVCSNCHRKRTHKRNRYRK